MPKCYGICIVLEHRSVHYVIHRTSIAYSKDFVKSEKRALALFPSPSRMASVA